MIFQITSGSLDFEVEADSQEDAKWKAIAIIERDAEHSLKYFKLSEATIRYVTG